VLGKKNNKNGIITAYETSLYYLKLIKKITDRNYILYKYFKRIR
jgi:hypothetical protein